MVSDKQEQASTTCPMDVATDSESEHRAATGARHLRNPGKFAVVCDCPKAAQQALKQKTNRPPYRSNGKNPKTMKDCIEFSFDYSPNQNYYATVFILSPT
eukprot:4722571-Amphidinium_carterae.1